MISRRKFVRQSLLAAGSTALLPVLNSCAEQSGFTGEIKGPNSTLGHKLRTMDFSPPTEKYSTDVVIVGGGVAGLSAARFLHQHSVNFKLLELSDEVGGNAARGKNQYTAFPWGAHYLPLPGSNDPELIAFLKEVNVITGEENGLPVFNEYYLCFDPKERLYINNYWQDSLIPHAGLPKDDRDQIARFTTLMLDFKRRRGKDGKEAFAIPVDYSSQDEELLALDQISMSQYLTAQGLTSEYLKWYVNYCCADDFGASIDDTSAWAGIHYFASRKGIAANAESDALLTWPEGNFFLIDSLRKNLEDHIVTNSLAYKVEPKGDHVMVTYYDAAKNSSISVTSRKVILATPQYINQRILIDESLKFETSAFHYAPWMVANITIDSSLDERRGAPLSWDNVFYGSKSMGYVNANHQHISIRENKKVITYYLPLTGTDVKNERLAAYGRTYDQWKEIILSDLRKPHPKIEQAILHLDVWLWGHGMIRPGVGFMWGEDRKNYIAAQSANILKAHSDMSGISIFEEAFYRGHIAAKQCIQSL
jgi:predicted NAD/FAD-binding protein